MDNFKSSHRWCVLICWQVGCHKLSTIIQDRYTGDMKCKYISILIAMNILMNTYGKWIHGWWVRILMINPSSILSIFYLLKRHNFLIIQTCRDIPNIWHHGKFLKTIPCVKLDKQNSYARKKSHVIMTRVSSMLSLFKLLIIPNYTPFPRECN